MSFVLDASITMAWFFKDEQSNETEALLQRAMAETIHVPVGWAAEVVNTVVIGERRDRCTPMESTEFLGRLQQLDIHVDSDADPFARLPHLCRRYKLTAYDAAYLELALRLQLPLATRDQALADAARAENINVMDGN